MYTRSFFKIILLIVPLMLVSTNLCAQDINDEEKIAEYQAKALEKKQKKALEKQLHNEKIDTRRAETYKSPVYMFGVSAMFGDTIVYITDINEVENVELTRKYDYLTYRSEYSYQFTQFLGDKYNCSNQTTSVFFDKNKKKLMKRFTKLMKRYMESKDMKATMIGPDEFKFKVPEFSNVVI